MRTTTVALLAAKMLTAAMLTAGAEAGGAYPNERVTVCISPATKDMDPTYHVGRAQLVTSKIYAKIGVTLHWESLKKCPNGAIQIVWSSDLNDHPGASAYAYPYQGVRIVVFFDRIAAMVDGRRRVELLGHVMAHEIGHALQGISRHAETGVMKANFTPEDCNRMFLYPLEFSAFDAVLIRLGVERRAMAAAAGDVTASAVGSK